MADELAQDDELLREFVNESEEQLQIMEQDLLGLESKNDPEILNRIFRAMHTIKGTSSFLQFDVMVELAHEAEDVLNGMRRGEFKPGATMIDTMLRVCDRLRKMLGDVASRRPLEYNNRDLIEQLKAVRETEVCLKLGEIL